MTATVARPRPAGWLFEDIERPLTRPLLEQADPAWEILPAGAGPDPIQVRAMLRYAWEVIGDTGRPLLAEGVMR